MNNPEKIMKIKLWIILVFSLMLLIGCTKSADNYPLYVGDVVIKTYLPVSSGKTWTLGDVLLIDLANEPVTIIDVSLVNGVDMKIDDCYLVKIGEVKQLIGFRSLPFETDVLYWDDRIQAVGATLNPNEEWNLVLVVTSQTEETASADAIQIIYEDSSGKRYKQNSFSSYLITEKPILGHEQELNN